MPGWDSVNRYLGDAEEAEIAKACKALERNGYEVIDAATVRSDRLADLIRFMLIVSLACGLVGSLVAGVAGMAAGLVVAGLVIVATGGTVWGR